MDIQIGLPCAYYVGWWLPVSGPCRLWATSLLPEFRQIVLARVVCEVVRSFVSDQSRGWRSEVNQHAARRYNVRVAC